MQPFINEISNDSNLLSIVIILALFGLTIIVTIISSYVRYWFFNLINFLKNRRKK